MHGYQKRKSRHKKNKRIIIATTTLLCCLLIIVTSTALSKKTEIPSSGKPEHKITPSVVPTNGPTIVPTIAPTSKPTTEPTSTPVVVNKKPDKSNYSLFDDAVFIGDSRTEGLQLGTGLTNATFLTSRGLTVSTALTEKNIRLQKGGKGTIIDALKEKQYKKVFVMFGVNELGWPYTHTFATKYKQLLEEIQIVQPNATIYVQSIIPVTKQKSDSSPIYNNKNIQTFNEVIIELTQEMNLTYLDVKKSVTNKSNILPSEAATDGVHLTPTYCQKWLNYIMKQIA